MKQNVGKIDKIIRVSAALLIAFAGYYFNMWQLYILALVPLVTAIVGFCPLYLPLKINTNKKEILIIFVILLRKTLHYYSIFSIE